MVLAGPARGERPLPPRGGCVRALARACERHAPGPIYFVDVREREARLLERLFPFARASGSSLVKAPPIPSAVEQQIGLQDMTESQKVAAVVALQHLGYKVNARSGLIPCSLARTVVNA